MVSRLHMWWQLLRLHRPVGTLLLFWPCAWGALVAAHVHGTAFPYAVLLAHALGALFLRSAGCIINDIFDRHIDARVERTKNRPLACGAIKVPAALAMLALLLLGGLMVLSTLPLRTAIVALCAMPLVVLYPLSKRFMRAPQVVLGIVFSWGAFTGYSAQTAIFSPIALLPYAAAVFFTIGYDTIYASPDAQDDAAQKLNSTPLLWGKNSRYWVAGCYAMTVLLFGALGVLLNASIIFWLMLTVITTQLGRDVWQYSPLHASHCDILFHRACYAGALLTLACAVL